jgi:uncharacterized membrane protein
MEQRDTRSSWSSTQLWPTRGIKNTAYNNYAVAEKAKQEVRNLAEEFTEVLCSNAETLSSADVARDRVRPLN